MRLADGTQAALSRLYRGLLQRELMADDPRGQAIVDGKLTRTLDGLAASLLPDPNAELRTPPPRRIAVAMALAVFSHPHLSSTFVADEKSVSLEPLVASNEVLENALGLSTWELDDLREEVDRRAGSVLKQGTLVQWLQTRYRNQRLYQLLFPGGETEGATVDIVGSQMYAIVDAKPVPRHALYLPWAPGEGEGVITPLGAFRGRYVDASLKRALQRGIGATDPEISDLLERTVTLFPREGREALRAHDAWRRCGLAALTSVGQPYSRLSWLAQPVDAGDVRWQDWIRVEDGKVELHQPVAAFDALVAHRVHHVLEALYSDLLARRFSQESPTRERDEVFLFDLGLHVREVAQPIIRWVRAKSTCTWLARATDTTIEHAEALLAEVQKQWTKRLEHWTRPDPGVFDHAVLSKWTSTLSAFDGVLTSMLERPADSRGAHRDLLFLFAGHYITETPVDRGLMAHGLDPACPGLAIGRWFWPTWMRLLDALEAEATNTNAEFVIPDGLF